MNKGLNKLILATVGKLESRPILQCVHYENGYMVGTDAKRLFRLPIANKELKATINPITFETTEVAYPDVDRLIPSKFKLETTFTLEELKTLLPFLKANKGTKKNINFVKLTVSKDNVDLEITYGANKGAKTEIEHHTDLKEDFTIYFNTSLLYDYVDGIVTYAKGEKVTNLDSVFHFEESVRPLLITVDKLQLEYLITPVRCQ